jgi:hypothetical protein
MNAPIARQARGGGGGWAVCACLMMLLLVAGCGDTTYVYVDGGGSCPDAGTCTTSGDGGACSYTPPLGNVGLTYGWIPENGTAGLPSQLVARVKSDTAAKYNSYVKLTLVPDPPPTGTSPTYPVAGVNIAYLKGGEETEVTATFPLPADLPAGTYRGVFTLNEDDFHPEDDQLQGEAAGDEADNRLETTEVMTVVAPTEPVVSTPSVALESNSLTVSSRGPTSLRDPATLADAPDLSLNLELVSDVLPVTDPVDVIFELDVPGADGPTTYRLSYLDLVDSGSGPQPTLRDTYTAAPTCRDATGADVDPATPGATCAALHPGSPQGRTFALFLPDDFYSALPDQEITCTLRVTVDPTHAISVWNDDRSGLVTSLPLQLIPAPPPDPFTLHSIGPKYVYNLSKGETWGNGKFNAGWSFSSDLKYWTTNYKVNGDYLPTRGAFSAQASLPVTVFGQKFNILGGNIATDLDIDNITGSYFQYGVTLVGFQVWGDTLHLAGSGEDMDELVLFSTKDSSGNERFSKSKSIEVSATVWIWFVPITISGGIEGEIGLKGQVAVKANNVLELNVGPYARLGLVIKAGVGVPSFSVGVGGELTLIEAEQAVKPFLQFLPSLAQARVGVAFPLTVSTLGGRLFLYYDIIAFSGDFTIISWSGFHWELNLIQPMEWMWGFADGTGLLQPDTYKADATHGFLIGGGALSWGLCPTEGCATFEVYYVGDRFALKTPGQELYLTYVADAVFPVSRLQLLPLSGGTLEDENLFTATKGWVRLLSGDSVEAWTVRTSGGTYWHCADALCGSCELLDARANSATSTCAEVAGQDQWTADDSHCCAGRMFSMPWQN